MNGSIRVTMCDIRATHRLIFRKKLQLDKYLVQYGLEHATRLCEAI